MAPPRVRPARAVALVLALALPSAATFALAGLTVGGLGACRSKPAVDDAAAAATSPSSSEPPKTDDGETDATASSDTLVEAGARFRDAEPKVAADPDGPVDAACSGMEIAFDVAVVDKRCAIGSGRAKQLRATLERDGGGLPLRQEAKVAPDGRVVVRLVNTGPAALILPLSFSAKLPAFTVIAEDDRHSLYELEPPRFEVGAPSAAAANDRPHFARIVLPPGGAAVATIAVQGGVARVVGRSAAAEKCPDGGTCAPSRLAKGRYVLHVGELLTDVEAGAPARVTWDLP
jgi:hypothetical protein